MLFACRHEYGDAEVTLELVDTMDEAIDHLHDHGSGHTECIVTGVCLCALACNKAVNG